MARVDLRDADWSWQAIVDDLLANDGPMLAEFLDQLGIENTGGRFDSDTLPTSAPISAADIIRSADLISQHYSREDVVVYMLALGIMAPVPFEHTSDWLDLRLREAAATAPAVAAPPKQPEQPEPSTAGVTADDFTTLDKRLVRVVVDCAARIEGAPTEDEVDDIIAEVEQLNGARHRTFFHCGYRDAVFDRRPVDALAAENTTRREWYWSGYINGVARRHDYERIVALLDAHPAIATIGQASLSAGKAAIWLVFRALTTAGRYAEAANLATPGMVAASAELKQAMLATGRSLVRSSRAAEARLLLDPLWAARTDDDDEDDGFWLEVKRRRALCLRQLGEQAEALALLEELADHEDAGVRAVALTDIGLLRAGKRRLGEISMPPEAEQLPDLVAALSEGEPFFNAAIAKGPFQPAHALYSLGLLSIAKGEFEQARPRLEAALSFFAGNPELYRADGSLSIAELYTGVAICHEMDPARLPRARELIHAGLQGGARLPNWLIRSTIDSLSLGHTNLGIETATELIALDGGCLEVLIASEAGHCTPALTSALFARAAQPSRSAPNRAADYLLVLPMLLQEGSIDRAADALDYLEERAIDGILTTEVVEFLAKPDSYSPAWSVDHADEVRARLLESQGRLQESSALLEQVCWRVLSRGEPYALDEAELIVAHLDGYGPAGAAASANLSATIDARRAAADAEPEHSRDDRPVRILIVGGNEVQQRMHDSIESRVQSEVPNVTVEWLHSGWSGDWARYSEEFFRRVRGADGVVMLAMMRTTLGWTVRQNCPVPWAGCRGRGQGQIFEAIKRSAAFARRHHASCVTRESV